MKINENLYEKSALDSSRTGAHKAKINEKSIEFNENQSKLVRKIST
jgi:hypothetical protein